MFLRPLTSARLALLDDSHMVSMTDRAVGFGANSGNPGTDKTGALIGGRRTAAVFVSAVRARMTGAPNMMHEKHDRQGAADEEHSADTHGTRLPSRCFVAMLLPSTVDVKN